MLKPLNSLFLILFLLAPATSRAADFDIDSGRVVLRRLQYCTHCGSALLVTRVHPGVVVRCPDCGSEQPRLPDKYLLTQTYQLCKLCQGPLDTKGHHAGDVVECGNCHTRQALSRDAFVSGPKSEGEGRGYAPGFPPGTGKKTLLFSPERPDAPITPIPLDAWAADLSIPDTVALPDIPKPPATRELPGPPPMPDLALGSVLETVEPSKPGTDTSAAAVPGDALEVPAVTVDLFGGGRSGSVRDEPAASLSSRVAARVDDVPIFVRDVDRIVEPAMARLREQAGPGVEEQLAKHKRSLRREVVERLIDRELAAREAAAIGYRPDPNAVRERENELAQILTGGGVNIRREAVRDVTMADMRKRYAEKPGAVSPQAVREFYRQNREAMLQPRLVALDQLVVYEDRVGRADRRNYREVALEISSELERGRKFDELRERHDEFCVVAGLPPVDPPMLPEEAYARQVVLAGGDLRKGAVFGPLFMPGMALFGKVVDERPEGPIPFEEVEKDIRKRLESEAEERNLDAWLKRLRQKARVEVLE